MEIDGKSPHVLLTRASAAGGRHQRPRDELSRAWGRAGALEMSQRGLAVVSVLCVWVASTQAALYSPAARFFADAASRGRASPARPGGWRIAAAPRMYGDEEDAGPHSKEEDDSYSTCDATRTYLASTMESGFSRYTDEGSRILNAPQRYSSKDWLRTLLTLGQDRGLIAVRSQFLSTVAFSLLVSLFYIRFPCMPTLPALPHSLLGGVLSVLLGFRTNQSYQRFWEGRTLWGQVFDRCRTTLRTAQAYMDGGVETYETILRHLKAFPTALKQHLRGGFLALSPRPTPHPPTPVSSPGQASVPWRGCGNL